MKTIRVGKPSETGTLLVETIFYNFPTFSCNKRSPEFDSVIILLLYYKTDNYINYLETRQTYCYSDHQQYTSTRGETAETYSKNDNEVSTKEIGLFSMSSRHLDSDAILTFQLQHWKTNLALRCCSSTFLQMRTSLQRQHFAVQSGMAYQQNCSRFPLSIVKIKSDYH